MGEKNLKSILDEIMRIVSPRARGIIEKRFGIRTMSYQTLEAIGKNMGITRERVRQILFWGFGVTRWDGGVHARSVVNKFRKKSKLDALRMERSGCSQSEYIEIRDMRKGPTGPYTRQRHNAIARGIEWKFSLWSWWQFWQESGKWSKRGRGGNRYVMCRFGDVGPYSPDNCYIATSTKNLLHYREKRDGKLTLFSTPKDLERIDDEIGI